jgi:hypothetical protein
VLVLAISFPEWCLCGYSFGTGRLFYEAGAPYARSLDPPAQPHRHRLHLHHVRADHPGGANLGQILQAKGDLAGAEQYTQRALAISEKVYGSSHPMTMLVAGNLKLIEKLRQR